MNTTLLLSVLVALGPRGMALTPRERLKQLCGPASLSFCIEWLGGTADVGQVARLAGLDRSGTSLAGLADAAEELGFEGRYYRLRLEDLRRVRPSTPGIAHVDGNHFVVAWMTDDDEVSVIDPPGKVSRTSLREFGKRWDGAILIVSRPGERLHWPPPWGRITLAAGCVAAFGLAWTVVHKKGGERRAVP